MHLGNLYLRSWLQERIGNAFDLFDLGAFHPAREVERRALADTVDYIERHMAGAMAYYSGKNVLAHAMRLVPAEGLLLEFGVYKGGSINFIAGHDPGRPVYGFDSFQGLPEDWGGWRDAKGAFSLDGRLPRVRPNVELVAGLFEQTVAPWLGGHPGPVALAHVDCDIYSSAKLVLDLLAPRLDVGSVVVFDEYFNFPFWREHEFKAWQDVVKRHGITYRYLAYARTQAAVIIEQALAS